MQGCDKLEQADLKNHNLLTLLLPEIMTRLQTCAEVSPLL